MGKVHLRSLASVPSAEVVALVDPNEETLASVAAENGVPSTYTDVASMLAAEQPEYAIVASPVLYHAEQSIAAFEAGAHVLCEKPLSMNMAEAEAIVEAARRAQRLFTMGFQLRQSRAYRALKEFIDEGRLGEVYHARVGGTHHGLSLGALSPSEGILLRRRHGRHRGPHPRRSPVGPGLSRTGGGERQHLSAAGPDTGSPH